MSQAEIIDVLDETGKVLRQMPRGEAEDGYQIFANALVFLFNEQGRVWVQLRPRDKHHFPGLWDITACGGLLSGEEPLTAALRETHEETGLVVELHHVETFINVFVREPGGPQDRRISHLYIGITSDEPQLSDEADDFQLWEAGKLEADLKLRPDDYVPAFSFEFEKALAAYRTLVSGRQTK